ncbi:Endonuclease Exonuclease phosphatase family [Fusarium albosuccineum]|uniref:Endonuclease Exonuclease phosphatase family n=1 Tax=Fusarium albosuccineum TaxID=1237068 RepID=A0A8H4KV68_9HYPO|nr:Endonuclease Exonuclease phosphatase family [Fusarium albosuccineum]
MNNLPRVFKSMFTRAPAVPLPTAPSAASSALKPWHQSSHQFIPSTQSWARVDETSSSPRQASELGRNLDPHLIIVTWNVDAGPVWRVNFPSRFDRDALCCDVYVSSPSSDNPSKPSRLRLVNVHLDSLAIQPSKRPEQLSIVADMLRDAGQGLVAGDFNPVLPEDSTLVENNGLVDAWVQVHGSMSGFTWGIDGKQRFPPSRLDKVAMLGLQPYRIEVMHPGIIQEAEDYTVPWSDHSGLECTFGL